MYDSLKILMAYFNWNEKEGSGDVKTETGGRMGLMRIINERPSLHLIYNLDCWYSVWGGRSACWLWDFRRGRMWKW
jgi:hypothetical protein